MTYGNTLDEGFYDDSFEDVDDKVIEGIAALIGEQDPFISSLEIPSYDLNRLAIKGYAIIEQNLPEYMLDPDNGTLDPEKKKFHCILRDGLSKINKKRVHSRPAEAFGRMDLDTFIGTFSKYITLNPTPSRADGLDRIEIGLTYTPPLMCRAGYMYEKQKF